MCRPSRWVRRVEVERGHSSYRRLHFGKGMQSTRGWPRSTSRFRVAVPPACCDDFSTQAEAQALYECCMAKVGYDVHRLDRDRDGVACEALP